MCPQTPKPWIGLWCGYGSSGLVFMTKASAGLAGALITILAGALDQVTATVWIRVHAVGGNQQKPQFVASAGVASVAGPLKEIGGGFWIAADT